MRNKTTSDLFQRALTALKVDFISVSLVPFSKDIPENAMLADECSVVCWGPGFVPRVLGFPNLSPGIWYDHDNFRWSAFQLNWKELMMSRDGRIKTLETAFSNLSSDSVFIRPDADNKAFTGAVCSADNPPKPSSRFPRDMTVVVAEPQNIEHEWRFVIVNGRVISASSYRVEGLPNIEGSIPEAARDLAERAVNIWCPADVFCLDIGFNGKRYGIVEANCFNASRLYQADPMKVISSINDFLEN